MGGQQGHWQVCVADRTQYVKIEIMVMEIQIALPIQKARLPTGLGFSDDSIVDDTICQPVEMRPVATQMVLVFKMNSRMPLSRVSN